MGGNALNDLNASAEPSEAPATETSRGELAFNFISKALFTYLPLSVYIVVNIPYFKSGADEQGFFKGMFLALSYVFISQANNIDRKQDAIGNILYSTKIFCGVVCIALFATDKFNLNWWLFAPFFLISCVTLFFSNPTRNLHDR